MSSDTSSSSAAQPRLAALAGGLTAVLGIGALRYLRANRRAAAQALHDAVSPPSVDDVTPVTGRTPVADEAHAPGHQHLAAAPSQRRPSTPRRARARADRTGHPGRFG